MFPIIMPRRPAEPTVQTAVRFPKSWLARLDAVAAKLTEQQAGNPVSQATAIRVCLSRGLEVVEKEYGLAKPKARRE
jgi:hypothetical protein